MNIPNTMMVNATTCLGWMRSESIGAAPIIAGLAVVASAMAVQLIASRKRATYCGCTVPDASRSVSLSASSAPLLVSTVM